MIFRAASPSLVATVAGLLLLGGCLAEFHTDQPKPVAPAATVGVAARTEVQGTAAIGLPIVGGTVSAICIDQNPAPVTTAANGTFQLKLPFELSAPCILRVSGGTVNNIPSTRVMYGYVEQTGVGNITPLTELVLARAAAAQPATVYNGFTFTNDVSDNIDNALRAAKTYVLAQLTAATGFTVPSIDLLTGVFAIGDPMDLLLDELGARLRAANHTQDELRALAVTGGNFAPLIPPLPTGPIVVPEPIWGSLTISGTGLPAPVLTPFKPNNLPVQTTQRLGWARTSLVGATIVSNQTVNVNYTAGVLSSISLQAGAITATVSCPSTACDAPTLIVDTLAKTVTFNDLPMMIGTVAATIKGVLQYSDFAPFASNSIDSVALAACPKTNIPATDSAMADLTDCAAGLFMGTSDLGHLCTVAIDSSTKSMRLVADNVDSTIVFGNETVNGVRQSNLTLTRSNGVSTYRMTGPVPFIGTIHRSIQFAFTASADSDLPAGRLKVDIVAENRTGSPTGNYSDLIGRKTCAIRLP